MKTTKAQFLRSKDMVAADPTSLAPGDVVQRPSRDEIILGVAKRVLFLQTLETRKMDGLDFSNQAVWSLKKALEEAYEAGQKSVQP